MTTKTQPKPQQPIPTKQELVEKLRATFIEEAAKAVDVFDGSAVAKSLVDDLKQVKREIALKLLGLDNHWGRWEVDHTNGRTSPVTKFISDSCEAELKALLTPIVKEVIEKERANTKKTLRKALEDEIRGQLDNYKMRQSLALTAEQYVKDAMDEVVKEFKEELHGRASNPAVPVSST